MKQCKFKPATLAAGPMGIFEAGKVYVGELSFARAIGAEILGPVVESLDETPEVVADIVEERATPRRGRTPKGGRP